MKLSVKLGLVRRAVCSSFHALATNSPRQALTGPGSALPPPLARMRRGFSQSRKKMSTLRGATAAGKREQKHNQERTSLANKRTWQTMVFCLSADLLSSIDHANHNERRVYM
jgi:hypothetical protein